MILTIIYILVHANLVFDEKSMEEGSPPVTVGCGGLLESRGGSGHKGNVVQDEG